MWTPSGVTIGRLRVQRGGDTDADPSRLAERAFGMLDLRPTAIPRGAFLCVRHLHDPAPGKLSLRLSDAGEAAAWSSSVDLVLADLARQAARPADGPVPAGAVAVLFRDDVELLACLAADWSQPGGRSKWWWQRLVRPQAGVTSAWLAAIPAVPAVVDRLARRGELQPSLAAIDDRDVVTLVDALAAAYAVPLPGSWHALLTASPGRASGPPPARPSFRRGTTFADRPRTSSAGPVRKPWAPLARELAGMDRPRTLFAGIALTLQRRPALARSVEFATAIAEWLRDEARPPVRARFRPRSPDGALAWDDRAPDQSGERAVRPPAAARRSSGTPTTTAAAGTRRAAAAAAVRALGVRARSTREAAQRDWAEAAAPEVVASEERPLVAGSLQTRLGGVFFLLNLALYLGLYGDFSRPREPGIRLDPWDFLTLLSAELGLQDELEADPLGELLRQLAGRPPGSRPGANWRPSPNWRVPPDWLAPFAAVPGEWRWSGSRGRLRVAHPAGFRVLDVITTGQATAAAVRRARAAPSEHRVLRRSALAPVHAAGHRAVDRWIALVGLYARARLRLALGVDATADLSTLLLRLPAGIDTSETEVDVAIALADLPIAVRAAGLDRDPGWIPAARRTVRFHFA